MNFKMPNSIAAVDIGSNSFHMVVADTTRGHIKVVDKMREMVRLAAGLGPDNRLCDEVVARAVECLQRFGERLRDFDADSVRVVCLLYTSPSPRD